MLNYLILYASIQGHRQKISFYNFHTFIVPLRSGGSFVLGLTLYLRINFGFCVKSKNVYNTNNQRLPRDDVINIPLTNKLYSSLSKSKQEIC